MTKNKTKIRKSEVVKHSNIHSYKLMKGLNNHSSKRLEIITAILLGITMTLSAWAAWVSSLHSGNQAINFTKSNNMASTGTAEYNMGMQLYLSDYMAWNTVREYYYELESAKADGDQKKTDLINEKIELFKEQNISDILADGIDWMDKNNEDNPFKMPGMSDKYFESAQENVNQSQELLEEGMRDNTKGDSYSLVTIVYSLTLFLLGVVGVFKNRRIKIALLCIAVAFLAFGIFYMFRIPLPTGFDKMNFFDFDK